MAKGQHRAESAAFQAVFDMQVVLAESARLHSMSEISEQLLDALMALPAVESLWLQPNQRRGSHFSRADEDLLIYAPEIDSAQWQRVMELVSHHEKWHLISVFRVQEVPVAEAKMARPREA